MRSRHLLVPDPPCQKIPIRMGRTVTFLQTLVCTVATCSSANCPMQSQSGRDLTEAGNKLYAAGKLEEARSTGLRRRVQASPVALQAAACYQLAIKRDGSYHVAWNNLGLAWMAERALLVCA